jgi:enamine deaminase RidA (YjgF/YER057c/UK114 family)
MSSIVGVRRRGPGSSAPRKRVCAAPRAVSSARPNMSPHRIVNAPELGEPSGFSHAVVATGTTVHLAGQIGAGATIAEQFDSAAENMMVALRAAGGEAENLVSLQIFVTDVAAYKASRPQIGEAWRKHFGRHYPAMGLFGVSELFEPTALVELMGVAVLPE